MSTWFKRSHGLHRNSPVFRERIVDAGPLSMPADVQAHRAPAANVEQASEQQPKPDPFLPDLPLGQKMVLLKLRKGELAAAILEKLHAMSAPEPVKADWSACIEARYIRRSFAHSNTGRLELLPPGLSAVGAIMRDLAPKYGIHLFQRCGGPATHSGAKTYCSCGWSTGPYPNTQNVEFVLARQENRHLDAVKGGTWKRPRPLIEFLNEVMPPRFDFSGPALPASQANAARPDNPGAGVASVPPAAASGRN